MLLFLHDAELDSWHYLVTSDESWFFFNTSPCRMWTLSRDGVVTRPRLDIQSKNSCLQSYRIRAASMLSTDSQMIPKWIAHILWQIYLFHLFYSNNRSFLEEGHRIKNNWWFISIIAQFTQVGLQQIGLKNTEFAACHTHPPYSPDLVPVTSTCFLQSKKNPNEFRWLTRTSFWVSARDFEGSGSTRIE
jgi:hypothetical protein